MKVTSILAFILVLSVDSAVLAEQPRLTNSPLSSLLEQPTVSAIYRDMEGILWIGTQQGLHRYDGVNLTVFNSAVTSNNWIPDSEIKDIAQHTDGSLYVATSDGTLLKWNQITASFDQRPSAIPVSEKNLTRFIVSMTSGIWLLSRNSISVMDAPSLTLSEWLAEIDLPKILGTPRDVLEDLSGNIWISGDLGIVHIDPEQKSLMFVEKSKLGFPENSSITTIGVIDGHTLVFGTDSGQLTSRDIYTGKIIAKAELDADGRTYISRFLTYNDQLLIGTDRGLYSAKSNLSVIENLPERYSNPNILSLYRDGEYVWVGTINGLDILSFSQLDLFDSKNSSISNDILAFEEDENENLWVGTYDGLYIYNQETRQHTRFSADSDSELIDHSVTSIALVTEEIWLGLIGGGVKIFNLRTGQSRKKMMSETSGGLVTKIMTAAANHEILIATYDLGLFGLKEDNLRSFFLDDSLPERSISVLFKSNTGVVLAASGNRLYKYASLADRFLELPLDFEMGDKNPIIYSLAQSSNGDILIGTKDYGLFLWARESQLRSYFKLQKFVNRKDLGSSTIYGIELDSFGSVWCSTENGIVKLNSEGVLLQRFTIADGLQGSDFTLGASYTSKTGQIYFGGINGYNRFDPGKIEIDSSPSPMRLTGISLPRDGGRILGEPTLLKKLQLSHNDRFVTFQFSVLDFIDAEKNQFRYMLENFDPTWIENGNRNTATYNNLPPGDYVLRVQGANSAGVWNRDGITLDVEKLPPPWLSWWAYSIYTLILALFFWAVIRIYLSYAIEKAAAQQALEMFEAENRANDDIQEQLELQDEMVQAAYDHNLMTLSLLSECIKFRSEGQREDAKHDWTESSVRRISALSSLEDCISFHAGGAFANLQKYTNALFPALLENASIHPETIVTINDVTSTPIPVELASPIAIILYELLENSMQHAFKSESLANYIHATLLPQTTHEPFAHFFELTIHDSGVGVPENIEETAIDGSGIGIVQTMVARLDGEIEFSGAKGTTVSIVIPNNT